MVEVGGTVGDIESLPFLEAIRQFRFDEGEGNTLYLHLTLVPYLETSEEFKTKPTQHSVATLRGVGIQPDIVVLRSAKPVPEEVRRKVALFTNVRPGHVFSSPNVEHLYEVPLLLEEQGLGRAVERALGLEPVFPNLAFWQEAVRVLKRPERAVRIAIAGKYVKMPDAYLSLLEALKHAGIKNRARVEVKWVDAEAWRGRTWTRPSPMFPGSWSPGASACGGSRARCGRPSTLGRGRSLTWHLLGPADRRH